MLRHDFGLVRDGAGRFQDLPGQLAKLFGCLVTMNGLSGIGIPLES